MNKLNLNITGVDLLFIKKLINNIAFTWFLTYILFTLISLVMLTTYYNTTKHILLDEVSENNKLSLSHIVTSYDDCLKSIERIQELAVHNNVIRNFAVNSVNSNYDNYYVREVMNAISGFNYTTDPLENCYFYFSSKDMFVNGQSGISSLIAYKNSNLNLTYDEWINIISNDSENTFITCYTKSNELRLLYVSKSFFSRQFGNPNMSFIAVINPFGKELNVNIDYIHGFFFKDFRGNIAPLINKSNLNSNELYALDFKNSDCIKINKHEYLCLAKKSKIWNIDYMFLTPTSLVYSKIRIMVAMFLLFVALMIIIGIGMGFYFSRKNFLPILSIAKSLHPHDNDLNINTYKVIEKSIISANNENILLKDKVLKQEEILKQQLYTNLLHGMNEEITSEQLNLISNKFLVIIMHFEEENDESLYSYAASNIFCELVEPNDILLAMDKIGFCVFVINLHKNLNQNTELFFKEIINKTINVMKNEFNINVNFSVSDTVEGVNKLNTAYKVALFISDFKISNKKKDILFLKDINNDEQTNTFFCYNIEQEQMILDSLSTGNAEKAKQLIKNIFNKYISSNNISFIPIDYLSNDIFCTIIKSISKYGDRATELLCDLNIAYKLNKAESVNDYITKINKIADMCCNFINKRNPKHFMSIEENVMIIIEENYTNPNFCINEIADKLKMHPTYLSASFKEQCGEGLAERIVKTRLKYALPKLQEGTMTIKEISQSVGFINYRTFSSNFKRYYGILPSEYIKS